MPTTTLTLDEIDELARAAFTAAGCDEPNTEALVRTVVTAERDGSVSHGLFRVPGYVASLRSGKVDGHADPTVRRTLPALVEVDGAHGYAPLALERGLPVLAGAAAEVGVAAMAVRDTHHFAALWPEVEALAARELIGIACTAYMPFMAPHGGGEPIFGTNPIAFAYPRPDGDPVVVDMATSAMALGEVQVAARDGHEVPPGTGVTAGGEPTTDPSRIETLLPFGGHKGSAVALMVELLSAGAIGQPFSFEAAEADDGRGDVAEGGELLLALSPRLLGGDDWAQHTEHFLTRFESIEGARLPGARRHRNRRDTGPREVDSALVEEIRDLAG